MAFGRITREFTGRFAMTKERVIGDYDVWFKPCEHCGHDTGRVSIRSKGRGRCWKCGRTITRDFSDIALKNKANHD